MVLQILADPWQRMDDRRADRLEAIRGADARKLQEVGRADRARGQYHFTSSSRLMADAMLGEAEAYGAATLEQEALHMRAGCKMQVRRLRIGFKKRRRRAPAPPRDAG